MSGRLRIDLDALAANFQAFQAAAAPGASAAVLKADGYGLGARPLARRLWREGCRSFFVATAAEGVTIRTVLPEARIFVFEGVWRETLDELLRHALIPVLNHGGQLDCWLACAAGRPAAVHIDTGMQRLGFPADAQPGTFAGLNLVLLVTHLACADEPRHPLNRQQLDRFRRVHAGFPGVPASIANSAAMLLGREFASALGRPGIGLFGGNPCPGSANPMATVVALEGRVLQMREVGAGETVGYGGSWRADAPCTLAIVGVGYADGLPRLLSNRGAVWLAGERRPIIGRVSMDLTAVDATGLAVREGDWVEFFGAHVELDEVAGWAGTIGYEVLTRLGPRLARCYVGD
jgi:alanine racemase